jgi:hypothetical protein
VSLQEAQAVLVSGREPRGGAGGSRGAGYSSLANANRTRPTLWRICSAGEGSNVPAKTLVAWARAGASGLSHP